MAKVTLVPPPEPEKEVHVVLSINESGALLRLLGTGVSSGTIDSMKLEDLYNELYSLECVLLARPTCEFISVAKIR